MIAGVDDWAIIGAGVLPGDEAILGVLRAQDGLYSLVTRSAEQTDVDVIGSIVDVVHAADDAEVLIERIAHPDTQIVSMTITEGGYPVDDATGEFVTDRCDAGSAFDVLARGLDVRRRRNGAPLTVLSCDNVMRNGDVAHTALVGAAGSLGPELQRWIDDHVSTPNSMVDRITPATTSADVAWLSEHVGIADAWPVVTEPFRQWVIEDHFAGDRLPLERLDVIVTDDIEPYELTKLRLLNAGHSCLAYLAALRGFDTVDAAMGDASLGAYVDRLLHVEAKPTLPAAAGIDLDEYITSLIERFSNPAISDQIARLCLDGSAKFPKFLLPTIESQLRTDGPVELAALGLAGWCEYLVRASDPASDPLLDTARRHARASVDDPGVFLGFHEVFGPELAQNERFGAAFVAALAALRNDGVQSALDRYIGGASTA